LIGVPDAMLFSERDRITAFGPRQRIPLIGTSREMVVAGPYKSVGALDRPIPGPEDTALGPNLCAPVV
jgi:hypothetical protein